MSSTLLALSPLDGRYARKVAALRPVFSEFGLMHRRVLVEVHWLLALSDEGGQFATPLDVLQVASPGHALERTRIQDDPKAKEQPQRITP